MRRSTKPTPQRKRPEDEAFPVVIVPVSVMDTYARMPFSALLAHAKDSEVVRVHRTTWGEGVYHGERKPVEPGTVWLRDGGQNRTSMYRS